MVSDVRTTALKKAFEEELISDLTTAVDPIVAEDLWEECNAAIQGRKNGIRPTKRAVHLFSGMVFCECGGKMTVPSNSPKYTCPSCRRKIPTSDLEEIFRSQLHGFFLSEDDIREQLEKANADLTKKRALVQSLEKERSQLRSDMDKTYRLYLDGTITSQGFGDRYKPLEERLAQISDEIPRLQGEIDFMTVQNLSNEEIVAEARDLYGHWHNLEPEDKRKIVESAVQRITVTGDSVSIDLYYSPVPPKTARRLGTLCFIDEVCLLPSLIAVFAYEGASMKPDALR